MKFKKAFAWILAVAMVITLMPSMAFAATTLNVSKTPTVAADSGIPSTELTLRVDNVGGWKYTNPDTDGNPATPDDEAIVQGNTQTIRLTLENGTWDKEPTTQSGNIIQAGENIGNNGNPNVLTVDSMDYNGVSTSGISNVRYISSSENSLDFSFTINKNIPKDDYIKLTFAPDAIKAGSDAGPLNIDIDGRDSEVTGRSITVATVGTSNTVTSVSGTVKTFPRSTVADNAIGTTIEIRETAVNSLKEGTFQSLRLTAPKGVSFGTGDVSSRWTIAGDLYENGTLHVEADDRIANIWFKVKGSTDNGRNILTIKPELIISRDAAEGDIAIQLAGGTLKNDSNLTGGAISSASPSDDNKISDASDLVIAKYGNESVEVSTVSEVPTFISGNLENTKGRPFKFEVTLKENMIGSLDSDRYVDFELPDEVQICGVIKSKLGSASKDNARKIDIGDTGNNSPNPDKNMSSFSFRVPQPNGSVNNNSNWSNTKANTITFEVPVTVQADFTGDITCKVSGAKAGVDETELVVAKAESPIKVETKTTEVKNGLQTQAVADIIITENYPGYLDDDTTVVAGNANNILTVDIDTLGLYQGMVFESFESVTVTDGDIELGKCTKNSGTITIPIKNSSTKASTIQIKGAVVALNRTLPEGSYALRLYNNAVIKNNDYNNKGFADPAHNVTSNARGDVCVARVADYVKIVTPADPSTITNKINAVFTLRQDTFTNNGETVQMDTAPYLDANNRTQLPIRYAAIACGVPESDISWNQATQTATINGQNVVLRITIGSNIMQTSAGNVVMDTAAVSSNGRIFVPIRYIANALGADVAWDATAKTITLTN